MGVLMNQSQTDVTSVESTQEEADALLTLYASELHKTGKSVHIYFPDTDVLVFALSAIPALGNQRVVIVGTGANVSLEPIYIVTNSGPSGVRSAT